jgi:hypothetical protein
MQVIDLEIKECGKHRRDPAGTDGAGLVVAETEVGRQPQAAGVIIF